MTKIFLWIYDFLAKKRWLTITLAVALTLLFGYLASRVRYEEDIAKFLPSGNESRKYQEVYGQFASQNQIAVLFSDADGGVLEVEKAQEAMERFGELLENNDMVGNLAVTVDETQMLELMDAVYAHLPYLLEEADFYREA